MKTIKREMRFINRDKEVEDAELVLAHLATGMAIDFPIREYNGIGGIGKTALLTALWKTAQARKLPAALVDLSAISALEAGEFIQYVCEALIDQIRETSTQRALTESSKLTALGVGRGYSLDEIHGLARSESPKKIAVFLDSVDRVPTSFTEVLANDLLLPLLDGGRFAFFIASRSRVKWGTKQYTLGRRTKARLLELFSNEMTREQLSSTRFGDFADRIMSVTSGHPESTDLAARLLQDIERLENITIRDQNFGDYEKRLIDVILDNVRRDRIVPRDQFHRFYTLSVLRLVEVTIPTTFLGIIDDTEEWNSQKIIDLLGELQACDNLLLWQPLEKHYAMNDFVRRLFSLHMRVFFPEQYLVLSRAALKYYDDRLQKSLNDVHPDIVALVEKVYHSADIHRLSSPRKFDLQISMQLRRLLLSDLEMAIPGGGMALAGRREYGIFRSFEHRLESLESLKQRLRTDTELHERIGDLEPFEPERFLLQIVTDYEKEFLSADHAILDIVQSPRTSQQETEDVEEYVAAFITRRPEPITTCPLRIANADKEYLLTELRERQRAQSLTVQDLKIFGSWIFNKFLRDEVYNLISDHISLRSPLTISVDDTTIPWELMHDADDFIALKIPLGKRFRTAEPTRSGWGVSDQRQNKCLLVGVPNTEVAGFSELEHVHDEIEYLIRVFRKWEGVEFNPGSDILYGEEARAVNLERKLLTGDYRVIHFAGHAYYEIGEEGPFSEAGLVMFDRRMELNDIKSMTRGRPFLFLNACQSAYDRSKRIDIGYAGSYALGIASAFILSGALACVGNIWPVVDKQAIVFAQLFYNKLSLGKSLGEALRSAKESYRLEYPPQEHPFDVTWLAYVLYGDPTQKLLIPPKEVSNRYPDDQ